MRSSRTFPVSAETSCTAGDFIDRQRGVSAGQRGGSGQPEPGGDLGRLAVLADDHHAEVARRRTARRPTTGRTCRPCRCGCPSRSCSARCVALNGVGSTLFISSCCAVTCDDPLCRPTTPGRTAITRPTASSAAATPTAAAVNHRDRRRRQRTLSSTCSRTSGRSGGGSGCVACPATRRRRRRASPAVQACRQMSATAARHRSQVSRCASYSRRSALDSEPSTYAASHVAYRSPSNGSRLRGPPNCVIASPPSPAD